MSIPRSVAFVLLAVAFTACADSSSSGYDTIIRGGTIYDGLGGSPYTADLAISDDTIAAIGDLSDARADTDIDATGLAVSPGFINVLSWAAETLIEDGRSQSNIRQGVTLEVMGEGTSMGPLTDSMKVVMESGQGDIQFDVEWTKLSEFLEFLEARGVATNVASYIGAATVRIHELGSDDVDPTPQQLETMRGLVSQAMEEGALGISSSLIYAPGAYAETDELIALTEEAGRYGGMYISHLRSEGNGLLPAIDELITIAREADVPAEIYHLKQAGTENWDKLDAVVERINKARDEGLRITTDMYTYTAGATGFDAAMPTWVQAGGDAAWIERLKDPAIRARVLNEMRMSSDDWESLYLLAGSPQGVVVVGFKQDSLKYLTGKSVAEIAEQRSISPENVIVDLLIANDGDVDVVYFLMSEDNVRRQMTLPYMSFGSDAGSLAPEGVFLESGQHPRAYGNFARLLGKYVRDEAILPLEEAVRRLTSLPARNLKLRRRGELRTGFYADVVVFDPATIEDHATFADPHQYSTGVHHVLVNGTQVLRDGEHTGALPGRVVRGPGWTGWGTEDAANPAAALERALRNAASEIPAEVGIALIDLETGTEAFVDSDVIMHAASTMKVPVLLELGRQAAAHERSLAEKVVVRNAFTSIADGSNYTLTPEEDSEFELYEMIGDSLTLADLAQRMIVSSSNLATNLLIEEVDAARVRRLMTELGAEDMNVLRGVEDIPAFEAGMSNTTSALALARVMVAIASCEAGDVHEALAPLTPEDCAEMIGILADQEFTEQIPAGLPPGTRVANKTGWITRIAHDAAIIYPPDRAPYVLVVLTRGILKSEVSAAAIADISSVAWEAVVERE